MSMFLSLPLSPPLSLEAMRECPWVRIKKERERFRELKLRDLELEIELTFIEYLLCARLSFKYFAESSLQSPSLKSLLVYNEELET